MPALSASDFGQITSSNLAAVLGVNFDSIVQRLTREGNSDLNTYTTGGIYWVADNTQLTNSPYTGRSRAFLIVFYRTGYISQILVECDNDNTKGKIYLRAYSVDWNPWREL